MKLYQSFLVVICSLLISASCKKDNEPVNVILYKKTPSFIESYIAGKWELQYYKIGFAQMIVYVPDSTFWDFNFAKDSVYFINKTTISERHSIKWDKIDDYINGSGFIYVMNFNNGYPGFGVGGINNDTLGLFEPGPDGNVYYFTRH